MKNLLFFKLLFIVVIFTFPPNIAYSESEPEARFNNLTIEINVTDATCDNNDGEIEMVITGGVAPYTIVPNNLMNLSPGIYNFTINDSGSCVTDTTVIVGEDNNLSAFVDVLDEVGCSGNETAETIINIGGGTGNYIVMIDGNPSISEVSTGIFTTDLSGGSYGITITDLDDNCMFTDNFAVGQPSPIIISVDITDIDSCSGRILDLEIMGSGGTPPYDIDVNPMSDGVLVTVTDDEGCSEELFVENPVLEDALIFSQVQIFPAEANEDNGSIDITVSGGTPPYAYQWRDADNNVLSTDEDIEDLAAGTYFVNVSDSKACTITSGELIVERTTSLQESFKHNFSIFPNPNQFDYLYIKGDSKYITSFQILDMDGKLVKSGELDLYTKRIKLPSDLSMGMYYVKIGYDKSKVEVHKMVKL